MLRFKRSLPFVLCWKFRPRIRFIVMGRKRCVYDYEFKSGFCGVLTNNSTFNLPPLPLRREISELTTFSSNCIDYKKGLPLLERLNVQKSRVISCLCFDHTAGLKIFKNKKLQIECSRKMPNDPIVPAGGLNASGDPSRNPTTPGGGIGSYAAFPTAAVIGGGFGLLLFILLSILVFCYVKRNRHGQQTEIGQLNDFLQDSSELEDYDPEKEDVLFDAQVPSVHLGARVQLTRVSKDKAIERMKKQV